MSTPSVVKAGTKPAEEVVKTEETTEEFRSVYYPPEYSKNGFIDRIPSNWDIQVDPKDPSKIVAVSNKTNEKFEGVMEDFNTLLRGY
jgi:hypothetical protein